MLATPRILHQEALQGKPFGDEMLLGLNRHLDEFERWRNEHFASEDNPLLKGPQTAQDRDICYKGITVALRSKNNTPEQVEEVFNCIQNQICVSDVEVLLLNGGNRPDTLKAAQLRGIRVEHVEPDKTFHAKILNTGLERASHDHVFSMSAQGQFATNTALVTGKRRLMETDYGSKRTVAGVYGVRIPSANASIWERAGGVKLGMTKRVGRKAMTRQGGLGFLDAACSMVDRKIALELGGYPKIYGNGGADGELGKMMVDETLEKPYLVFEDGALAVHDTPGLGAIRSLVQLVSWARRGQPREYKERLASWHPHGGL